MKRHYLSLQPLPACLLREKMRTLKTAPHNWLNLETVTEKITLMVSQCFAWSDMSGFGPVVLI